jgi:hypothetical protein
LLARVRTALGARPADGAGAPKGSLRADGFSEAEIPGVIPDRAPPRTATEPETTPQTPATPAARTAG